MIPWPILGSGDGIWVADPLDWIMLDELFEEEEVD
jgi:hypothetical protein